MMKTLFLQAPSFEGFDGGAGARYQMRREVKSFWYPTWLAQPAALVEGSKLIDAPPHRLRFADIAPEAKERDLIVLHTSTPSFSSDIKTVRALKDLNPKLKIGMVGAKVAVDPTGSLQACEQLDFVGRNEFDFTVKEVAEGRDFAGIKGLSYRDADGPHRPQRGAADPAQHGRIAVRHAGLQARSHHRELFRRLSAAPLHLVLHRPRLQIALHLLLVAADRRRPRLPRAQRRPCHRRVEVGQAGVSAGQGILLRRRYADRQLAARRRARPRDRQARHHLVVQCQGQRAALDLEDPARTTACGCCWSATSPATSRSCTTSRRACCVDVARRFTKDCHELGIVIHGTFILGLPGETKETIEETIRFATEINPHTIQVSLAAPYPGTFLHKQATENGWFATDNADAGRRAAAARSRSCSYPHLSHTEIFDSVEELLQAVLFPRAEDRRHRRRDAALAADDEAPLARRRRVFPVPASARRGGGRVARV